MNDCSVRNIRARTRGRQGGRAREPAPDTRQARTTPKGPADTVCGSLEATSDGAGCRSAHRVPRLPQGVLDLADAQVAEVEDAGGQHRVGAGVDGRGEVARPGRRRRWRSPGRRPRARTGRDQLQVVAVLGAVRVHRVQQDLAGTELGRARGPLDGVDAGAAAPAVGGDLEAGVGGGALAGCAGARRPTAPAPGGRSARRSRRSARAGRWRRCSRRPCPRRPAAAGPRPATERTPPPTVSGMNTCSAVRRTTS